MSRYILTKLLRATYVVATYVVVNALLKNSLATVRYQNGSTKITGMHIKLNSSLKSTCEILPTIPAAFLCRVHGENIRFQVEYRRQFFPKFFFAYFGGFVVSWRLFGTILIRLPSHMHKTLYFDSSNTTYWIYSTIFYFRIKLELKRRLRPARFSLQLSYGGLIIFDTARIRLSGLAFSAYGYQAPSLDKIASITVRAIKSNTDNRGGSLGP